MACRYSRLRAAAPPPLAAVVDDARQLYERRLAVAKVAQEFGNTPDASRSGRDSRLIADSGRKGTRAETTRSGCL